MKDQRAYQFHPQHVMLTLLLVGLTVLFLALSAAYMYSRFQHQLPPIHLPWLFFVNTLILLASSWTLVRANKAYQLDDTNQYKFQLVATLILSVVFLYLQFLAWGQLFQQSLFISSNLSTSYVYALSILHFLHVLGGIPLLGLFAWNAFVHMKEPVTVLIYFSDPDKQRHLRLLTKYWHFLDLLWIYLVLFLGVNSLF